MAIALGVKSTTKTVRVQAALLTLFVMRERENRFAAAKSQFQELNTVDLR